MRWDFPVELSNDEQVLVKVLKRRSMFFVFLRRIRHLLFDEGYQALLEQMYPAKARGTPPLPAGLLAMVVLLQAHDGVSDAEAVERAAADDRWKMVLNCLEQRCAPFSQKALVTFRGRMLEHGQDQLLLGRTVELARSSGLFDQKKIGKLSIAIDSAPLQGAGKVEDTINLIARATRTLAHAVAEMLGVKVVQVAKQAKLELALSGRSVKALLDLNWDEPGAMERALRVVVGDAKRMQRWVSDNALDEDVLVADLLEQLQRILAQDLEPDPCLGSPKINRGVARDRVISMGDRQMRHGRKTRSKAINGYKRYESTELSCELTLAACTLPANTPEHRGADKMRAEIEQHGTIKQLHIDRAFLPSALVEDLHAQKCEIICRPYGQHSEYLGKKDFDINLANQTVRCPTGVTMPIRSHRATFDCRGCWLESDCRPPGTKPLRVVTIHPQESLLIALRQLPTSPRGRRKLRTRIAVEHNLAHHCRRQGPRARYKGVRKNDFDVRRIAAVDNLFTIARKSADGLGLQAMIEAMAA